MGERLTDDEWEQIEKGGAQASRLAERIIAARVQAAKAGAWDEGYRDGRTDVQGSVYVRTNPYRETETP